MRKILIANRGEIAVRVMRTLQQMGIVACAVYSDPDRQALHVQLADEAYALGGTTSLESYLNQDKLLELCRQHEIDAVHPGYGFLSENAGFARKCQEAGIVFIGPSADVIEAMGDKLNAKEAMQKAGVPICNYGVTIAYTLGIFHRALAPFPAALETYRSLQVRK